MNLYYIQGNCEKEWTPGPTLSSALSSYLTFGKSVEEPQNFFCVQLWSWGNMTFDSVSYFWYPTKFSEMFSHGGQIDNIKVRAEMIDS